MGLQVPLSVLKTTSHGCVFSCHVVRVICVFSLRRHGTVGKAPDGGPNPRIMLCWNGRGCEHVQSIPLQSAAETQLEATDGSKPQQHQIILAIACGMPMPVASNSVSFSRLE